MSANSRAKSDSYKDAGVDIDLAGKLLSEVKSKISAAKRPEVLAPVGGFGGLFQLDLAKYQQPVLVCSVDGVGTKLMIAAMMEKYDTVGFDIVNHCINDIAVQGAEPLYFVDYIGIGKLRSPLYEEVLSGLADACKAQNVALLGGETAEMPGMYGDDFDLVGCINGIVDRPKLIDGSRIKAGHAIIGLASSGLHTNGYSLARKVVFEKLGLKVTDTPEGFTETVGEALLKPHVCYWQAIKEAMDKVLPLDGLAHLTGGGFYDNIPRVLPDTLDCIIDPDVLPVPPIFKLIQNGGNIGRQEMYRVFNMGCGMVWFVPQDTVDEALACCSNNGFEAAVIGETVSGSGTVKIKGIDC